MEIQNKINIFMLKQKFYFKKQFHVLRFKYYKHISILAFKIIERTKVWNQAYYDARVIQLYSEVRKKEAILIKEKIVSLGKREAQVKYMLFDMPDRQVKIKLERVNFPHIYK